MERHGIKLVSIDVTNILLLLDNLVESSWNLLMTKLWFSVFDKWNIMMDRHGIKFWTNELLSIG